MCDCGSFFSLSPSKTNSYREISTPVGTPPSPLTDATLDRVWCRLHKRHLVKSIQVRSKVSAVSHQMPVQCEVAICVEAKKRKKKKKKKKSNTNIPRLRVGRI